MSAPPAARAGDAPPPAGAEVHIAGVLVHVRPLQLGAARRRIDALPGAEVFQTHADGRMVVVLEAADEPALLDALDAMRALRGVLSVAPVYQHAEPAADLHEEIEG